MKCEVCGAPCLNTDGPWFLFFQCDNCGTDCCTAACAEKHTCAYPELPLKYSQLRRKKLFDSAAPSISAEDFTPELEKAIREGLAPHHPGVQVLLAVIDEYRRKERTGTEVLQ